jgi:hypothetical protein
MKLRGPRVPCRIVSLCVIALAAGITQRANAAFSQVTCPVSPAQGPALLTTIGAGDFDRRPNNPIGSSTDYVFYNNGENPTSLTILTNSNVQDFEVAYRHFETEPCCDFMELSDAAGVFQYKGSLNPSNFPEVWASRRWNPVPNGSGAQSFTMRFFTDSSVAGAEPPRFGSAKPSCRASQTSVAFNNRWIQPNTRYDGLLLGTGDTIYMQVTQPANTYMIVSLDGKTETPVDFDLYVSDFCAMPDDNCNMARGFSSAPNEALSIAPVNYSRTLSIGVHSYMGGGHFAINAMLHHPGQHLFLNVCPVNFTPTSAERSTISDLVKGASAFLLAGSNGNRFIYQYTITSNQFSCASGCDICLLKDGSGVGHGSTAWGHVCGVVSLGEFFWGGGASNSIGLFHEFGHSCYGLWDEYTGPPAGSSSNTICGHTVMNNSGKVRRFCSVRHCLDGHSSSSSCPSSSNWSNIANTIFYGPAYGNSVSPTPNVFDNNVNLLNLVTVQ